jgi:succinoglycan biosynthesis protein ExoM
MSTSVCICILTYQRPAMLEAALRSLAGQRLSTNPDVELSLVVIDNDAAASGQAIFERMARLLPFAARYVVESEQGIVKARNRALAEASTADFIAFLDDDEEASPSWIDALVTAQRMHQADVVAGPVIPQYQAAPGWVLRGCFFGARRQQTGARVHFVETNNVLFRACYARQFQFDLRFHHSNGEDTYFFLQLERHGARMIWAADAAVSETIPRHRTTARWILRRARSEANGYTRVLLYMDPGPRTRCARLLRAIGAMAAGCFLLLTSFALPHRAVQGLRLIARSIGTATALLGSSHRFYRPVPAPPKQREALL